MKSKLLLYLNVICFLLFSPVIFKFPIYGITTRFITAGDWSNNANWDNGVPGLGDDVVIDADCILDNNASIPESFNSFSINAMLDNSVTSASIYLDDYLYINDGGNFLNGGDIMVGGNMKVFAGGTGTFYGSVEVDGSCYLEDAVTFNGQVDILGDMVIGNNTTNVPDFTIHFSDVTTFYSNLTIGGSRDGASRVIFQSTLEVSNKISIAGEDTLINENTLTAGRIVIGGGSVGILRAYGDINCDSLELNTNGSFLSEGPYSYNISYRLKMNGDFNLSDGTIKMVPPANTTKAAIFPINSCSLNDLVISGSSPVHILQYNSSNIQDLYISGDLTIENGAELVSHGEAIYLSGDFYCDGSYNYGTSNSQFVFQGGITQHLVGSVSFYGLEISTGTTLDTGNETPSVEPYSLYEYGYLLGNIQCMDMISTDATHTVGDLGCTITNGASMGITIVTRHTGSTYNTAPHSMKRWYNIYADAADNSVILRFYYRDSELNGNSENNLNIWRYANGSWQKFVPSTRDASNNYVEATVDVPAGDSDWILSDAASDQSLPVELISFTATATPHNGVLLNWTTASEVDNAGFEIHRKQDNNENTRFRKIAFVEGAGNSNMTNQYQYSDLQVKAGNSYSYKLYSVDFNGKRELIGTLNGIQVLNEKQLPHQFTLYQNYPNPFNQSTLIQFYLPEQARVQLTIYDATGRIIRQYGPITGEKGFHYLRWDGKDNNNVAVSSGYYFYSLKTSRDREIVRKMLLVR